MYSIKLCILRFIRLVCNNYQVSIYQRVYFTFGMCANSTLYCFSQCCRDIHYILFLGRYYVNRFHTFLYLFIKDFAHLDVCNIILKLLYLVHITYSYTYTYLLVAFKNDVLLGYVHSISYKILHIYCLFASKRTHTRNVINFPEKIPREYLKRITLSSE